MAGCTTSPGCRWHTLFSICAGIGPLIALLARPHRGARAGFVAPTVMTIGAYWLLAVFLFTYFILVPSLLPEARAAAQARLLYFVQYNRLLLLAGLGAAVWFARGTDWRSTYLKMGVGRRRRVRAAPRHESGDRSR